MTHPIINTLAINAPAAPLSDGGSPSVEPPAAALLGATLNVGLINGLAINAGGMPQSPVVEPPVSPVEPLLGAALINVGLINGRTINAGPSAAIDPEPEPETPESPEPVGTAGGALVNASLINLGVINGGGVAASVPVIPSEPEDRSFPAFSFYPVSFGDIELALVVDGVTLPASGFTVPTFGVPALEQVLEAQASPWQVPVQFGRATAAMSYRAASVSGCSFGIPAMEFDSKTESLKPVRFGAVVMHVAHPAQGRHFGRFGAIRGLTHGAVEAAPEQVAGVVFGVPALGGYGLRARTTCPVQFGRVTLSRSKPC